VVYGWGDGTYGELGQSNKLPYEKATILPYFDKVKINHIAAGARHSLFLDSQGSIWAMGDNSEDQCAISGRRAIVPEKILKDFIAVKVVAGASHNVAVSSTGKLYCWGGTSINSSWAKQGTTESKLRLMEDLKRRKVNH